ncbi:outer membrane beta-barrel protein [Geothrix sp. 21YS21S-2]|uniref:outer membrane beta-barrel protein n=1 Tax=Geothrix sp. 21YS21S-2 TaxID=3068893 RepID=UPI0027BAE718|nr:outer membrane beta-barrel protein [Geothrix sp. 21YS21S-2]
MRSNLFTLPILLTCLAGGSLAAQDFRLGVQGGLVLPSGDLSDSASLGLQVGGHARWDFGRGHGLMARADLTSFGRKDGYGSSSLGIGADYTYHFDRARRGVYVLAGLSAQNYSRDFPDGTSRDSGLGIDLGAGYDLDRNLGLQARFTSVNAGHDTLTALCLGVTYTF